jgi:hypothetical protein
VLTLLLSLHRLPAAVGPARHLGHHRRLEHGARHARLGHEGPGLLGDIRCDDARFASATSADHSGMDDARFALLGGTFVGEDDAAALLRAALRRPAAGGRGADRRPLLARPQGRRQIVAGGIPWEKTESDEKLFTWPDLVYTEMLCMIVLTIVMIVWSIALRAPLEQPANPTSSPNPAKAPWYFLGLQEMLVYFDPWLAGVVLPTLIIVGLMAMPYIDTNPKGNGYYSFRERKWEITIFLYGFLVLWSFLIITGTFLRGPNWNFFGPYEYWDPNKLVRWSTSICRRSSGSSCWPCRCRSCG